MKKPFGLLAFLCLLNILNQVDRNLLTSFAPQITSELNLSDSQFGLLTGLIFVFFYAVMGLFMGALADKHSRPKLIAAGLILWSALTAFSGAAKSFAQLAFARLLIGVGESALTPASMSMLSDVFPAKKRGTASAIYYLGVPLGAGASFLIAGILGPVIGWRNCFYILGAFGLFLSIFLLFMKDPERGAMDEQTKQPDDSLSLKESIPVIIATLKQKPALFYTMLGAVFLHIPLGSGQFAQLWLVRERGFEAAEIATIYGSMFIFFGTIGILIGGIVSDWYQARFKGGRTRFLAIFTLSITPLLLAYRLISPDSIFFYVGIAAGFVSFTAFYGPAFSTVQDLSPARIRGSMTAVLLLACNLLGIGFGAVLTGVLSDILKASGVSEPLTWSLITGDVIAAMTIVCFFVASIHYEKDKNKPTTSG
jgi:MFS family permease